MPKKLKRVSTILWLLLGVWGCNTAEPDQATEKELPTETALPAKELESYADFAFFRSPEKVRPFLLEKERTIVEMLSFGPAVLDSLEEEITVQQQAEQHDFVEISKAYKALFEERAQQIMQADASIYDVGFSIGGIKSNERSFSQGLGSATNESVRISDCAFAGDNFYIIRKLQREEARTRKIEIQRSIGTCSYQPGESEPAILYDGSGTLTRKNQHLFRVYIKFSLPKELQILDRDFGEEGGSKS